MCDTHCSIRRRTLLPVLNKRWAGLLQGPGPAWAQVAINTDEELPGDAEPDLAAMAAWFGLRSGSVEQLSLVGEVPTLPASVLASIFTSQAASLRAGGEALERRFRSAGGIERP